MEVGRKEIKSVWATKPEAQEYNGVNVVILALTNGLVKTKFGMKDRTSIMLSTPKDNIVITDWDLNDKYNLEIGMKFQLVIDGNKWALISPLIVMEDDIYS